MQADFHSPLLEGQRPFLLAGTFPAKRPARLATISGMGLALGMLGACSTPPPPPAPPLPGYGPPGQIMLTVSDVLTLQTMDQRERLLIAIASLATTHSNSSVMQDLGKNVAKGYQALQDKTTALARSADLKLSTDLSSGGAALLKRAQGLYGLSYDRFLIRQLRQPIPASLQAVLKKEISANEPLKGVATQMMQLQTTYATTAQAIQGALGEGCRH
ncbi:DUF4142 domain-containing protein [Oecophyllibacter saccharovorans]|uniref:DUF4142 domain-containing protein n=1 Tax=Oecophyllibacter saccharovorans TaxID=2558360 RepID=UPI00114322E9|nr:DUF4142 domain-containing protein [Oecophyllibacter saccharovorans]QDH14693.1 DUF4142 domain-containing protein [Oecophyllibacter saccharovorans]